MPFNHLFASGADRRGAVRLSAVALSGVALIAIAGCSKKPGGQVVAVVNSQEITQQELRTQAEAVGVPPGADLASFAPAVLDQVIQRNLLADYARQQGLDRGPEYVARRRQLDETLLATLALRKISAAQGQPSTADAQTYISQNPAVFAKRQRLTLDQIRMGKIPPDQIRALEALGSIAAIQAKLAADKVPSARGNSALDTGKVESVVAKQIESLPDGKPFDLTTGGMTIISSISARQDVPADQAAWLSQAKTMLQRERVQKAMLDAVANLRKKAKIEYDPAFKPAPAKTP